MKKVQVTTYVYTEVELEKVPLKNIIKSGRELADGHFTLLCFTTNYRALFGTPFDLSRDDIERMPVGTTKRKAVVWAYQRLIEEEFQANRIEMGTK